LVVPKSSTPSGTPARRVDPTGAYIVRPRDTLWGIAARHGVTVATLCETNNISEGDPIYPGQRLVVPSSQDHERPTRALRASVATEAAAPPSPAHGASSLR
jgi:LysM repeat protein